MKKILFITLILLLLLASCRTTHSTVDTQRSTAITPSVHDTLYKNQIKYDSIFIDRWHDVDRNKDTVLIRDRIRELSYHVVHDTLHQTVRDTVPVVKTVEVVKREPYTPSHIKVLAIIGIVAVLWVVIRVARNF